MCLLVALQGASVLRMLADYVGEDVFHEGVKVSIDFPNMPVGFQRMSIKSKVTTGALKLRS